MKKVLTNLILVIFIITGLFTGGLWEDKTEESYAKTEWTGAAVTTLKSSVAAGSDTNIILTISAATTGIYADAFLEENIAGQWVSIDNDKSKSINDDQTSLILSMKDAFNYKITGGKHTLRIKIIEVDWTYSSTIYTNTFYITGIKNNPNLSMSAKLAKGDHIFSAGNAIYFYGNFSKYVVDNDYKIYFQAYWNGKWQEISDIEFCESTLSPKIGEFRFRFRIMNWGRVRLYIPASPYSNAATTELNVSKTNKSFSLKKRGSKITVKAKTGVKKGKITLYKKGKKFKTYKLTNGKKTFKLNKKKIKGATLQFRPTGLITVKKYRMHKKDVYYTLTGKRVRIYKDIKQKIK
ncbi:MAG: hypothetical protein LBD41_05810 [Clostridiales Family XIII bacterium]|jgi:hypothetical protein|nr:hypothetical protein [Clostridiales Family XIII bacterium]